MGKIKKYDEGARRRYYDMFINQHTMSMTVFCKRYGINTSTFRSWVKKYKNMEKECKRQFSPKTMIPPKDMLIPVPKDEYFELQRIKCRYEGACMFLGIK